MFSYARASPRKIRAMISAREEVGVSVGGPCGSPDQALPHGPLDARSIYASLLGHPSGS
ncbi:MAG TPA: hypothetical protein VK902_21545 [Rubrobacter sp.]|nr:hypothetical protein [Rubrobacter sp.]